MPLSRNLAWSQDLVLIMSLWHGMKVCHSGMECQVRHKHLS